MNTALPMECLRVLAGFPKDPGHFYLQRAALQPPESLQKKFFPWIEKSFEEVMAVRQELGTEMSGKGFLNLMKHLRTSLLQDAAIFLSMVFIYLFLIHFSLFILIILFCSSLAKQKKGLIQASSSF